MNRSVIGMSVQGASHIRAGKECQDARKIVNADENCIIIAVADGHGSNSCPYSKTGAEIAVNVFTSVMINYYQRYKLQVNGMETLCTFLNREGEIKVAQEIELEWKKRVYKQHQNHKRMINYNEEGTPDKGLVYKMYGSTLLGLMITETFIFAFQLGDGDINYIDADGVKPIIVGDKILGVETHSLSRESAWKNVLSVVVIRDVNAKTPYLYMVTSDGMANSYSSQKEFEKTCIGYYDLMKEYGGEVVSDNLENWLSETSSLGCGDDITVVLALFN